MLLAGVLPVRGGLAPTLTYATCRVGAVFWPRSGCRMAKDPGAKLEAA